MRSFRYSNFIGRVLSVAASRNLFVIRVSVATFSGVLVGVWKPVAQASLDVQSASRRFADSRCSQSSYVSGKLVVVFALDCFSARTRARDSATQDSSRDWWSAMVA